MRSSNKFIHTRELKWESPANGVERQILGYDPQLMVVKIKFQKGAIGEPHLHPHSQSTYVASGSFEVEIGSDKSLLSAGDGFYVEPNTTHGVRCLEEGVLIDTFSPMREDFL